MVTSICNVYINSIKKVSLFKETFPLVFDISDNWLINIRGKHKHEIVKYIKSFKHSDENCIFFDNLYDDDWAKSTREMLDRSKYEYVYIFLEDHYLQRPIAHFKRVIQDAIDNGIDYFQYSAFKIGINVNQADSLYPDYTKYFYKFDINKSKIPKLKEQFERLYPFTLISICKKTYLFRILSIENRILFQINNILQFIITHSGFKYPKNRILYFTLNKLFYMFNVKLNIYPRNTPFNLERSLYDIENSLLPICFGGLREELFANWDDDNGALDSSLIKRGLYPTTLTFKGNLSSYRFAERKMYSLKKGEISMHQFYPNISRITKIPVKKIKLISGGITIQSSKEKIKIKTNGIIYIAANIKHEIIARKDSILLVSLSY